MNNQQAYNQWSANYDTVINRTRDLEGVALRNILSNYQFDKVLEIGCGTGKNTEWLIQKAQTVTGADFSEEMLAKAKSRIQSEKIEFKQMDIRNPWNFPDVHFDLITFSLVLEHIEDIIFIFSQALEKLKPGGLVYIGELHPYKQLQGSKARFETEEGIVELECYLHHFSDYLNAGLKTGLECVYAEEWFDESNRNSIPRLLTMIFQKKKSNHLL